VRNSGPFGVFLKASRGKLALEEFVHMLVITGSAAEAIRSVLAAVTPPDASMRISSSSTQGERWQLTVARPVPGDRVVKEHDVELLVARESASALDDKVLDARMEGGRVQFSVAKRG
jgi:iron-sulfur cluster assembly protein